MTVKYLDPYKDDPYGKIRGDKKNEYFGVIFEEAQIHKTEDAYIIAGWATGYTSLTRNFKPEKALEPGLVALPIYGKEYEIRRKDSDGKWQSDKVKPSLFELALYDSIADDEASWIVPNKALAINLMHIPDGMLLSLDAVTQVKTIEDNFDVTATELTGKLPTYTPPKAYRAGGGGGKSYGMSPEQRVEFIKKQLAKDIVSPVYKEGQELADLIKQFIVESAATPGLVDTYFDVLTACAK